MPFSRYLIPHIVFRIKELVLSCFLYLSYSFVYVGYEELFPIFAATSRKYSKYYTLSLKGLNSEVCFLRLVYSILSLFTLTV